ncbi:MAG: (deoxy)nucleoside triphosphate pyrophosphohydrolase [Terracidiphilus sp.]
MRTQSWPKSDPICESYSIYKVYTKRVDEVETGSGRRPPPPALRFVAAALIVRDREVLIGQRRADQPMGSMWEFPGGKIEPGESAKEALARELSEELGIRAEVGPAVTRIRHHYRRGGAVDLQFFAVREFSGEISNQIYQQIRWVKLEDLTGYEFLAADRGLIKDLAAGKLL